jgi:PPK2 family polyphosphate:nucleotide phosphotransferase
MSFHADLLVKPGSKVSLASMDAGFTHGHVEKEAAQEEVKRNQDRIAELAEMLYADGRSALLLVFQGMDTSGKDGTVKHVLSGIDPAGCTVTAFKAPSAEELSHDFLWRIHRACPRRGEIGVFNRSHYEDVGVVRVRSLVPEAVWKKRYDQINAFEQMLAENGTVMLTFFLHISRGEQKKRLLERVNDPKKNWKMNVGDIEERGRWGAYMQAYDEALRRCSTEHAPWYVIPSDKKWFRNLAVSRIVVETLESLPLRYPKADFDPRKVVIPD